MKKTTKTSSAARTQNRNKLTFDGKKYGVGRLVLAIVDKYVSDHPRVTYEQLKTKFPDTLHSLGVVQPVRKAKELSKLHRRFFLSDAIELKDKTVAVCSDFGRNNITKFLENAQSLGYKVSMR